MVKKRITACALALVLFVVALLFLSRLTEPKYSSSNREGGLVSEYYRAADNGEHHDVIFIGDCETYSSFCPPILWEEYSITSHVRGSPSQTVAQSYHILCETLQYETPEVIVFSVYALCRESGSVEAYNRMTLDGMRPSVYKVRAVYDSIGEGESALSYFLPLLRFHSRWSELSNDDLKYLFANPEVSHNGYFLRGEIIPCEIDGMTEESAPHPIPSGNLEYLEKMRQVCADSGIELILVKAPTNSWRYPWYEEWSDEIGQYATTNSINYYDLSEKVEEIGIDLLRDTYDGGLHLNIYGAEKTTRYFGGILKRYIKIDNTDDKTEEIWKAKTERYYNERNKSLEKNSDDSDAGTLAYILPTKRRRDKK